MKAKYYIQTMYSLICPDGTAYDYYFSKKIAIKDMKKLNKELKDKPHGA